MLAKRLEPHGIHYVSNPEFLREGNAVQDWFETDRIVLGGEPVACDRVNALYEDIDAPTLVCDIASAELIKYASNAFLAMKISFANEIANLCDNVDADITTVMDGVGMDASYRRVVPERGHRLRRLVLPQGHARARLPLQHQRPPLAAAEGRHRRQRVPAPPAGHHAAAPHGRPARPAHRRARPDLQARHRRHARGARRATSSGCCWSRARRSRDTTRSASRRFDSDLYAQEPSIEDAVQRRLGGHRRDRVGPDRATRTGRRCVRRWSGPKLVFDGRNCLDPAAVRAGGGDYVGVGRR